MDKSKANDISNTSDDDIRIPSAVKSRTDIRRRVHNGIEKRRKDKINYWIHKIAELLPFKDPKRESKNNLLENVFHYILNLKEKNESLMFGNNVNSIHVEEIRRLTKQLKELEEKNINYYRLLRTAGISPNSSPQDIAFERPTKYSKKITEEQVRDLFKKSLDNCSTDSESMSSNNNNKRNIDCELNNEQNSSINCNKKSKSKSKSKKRKDLNKKENVRKSSPPTPVLPNNSNNNTNCLTSGQTSNSGSIVLLNDQNVSTVSDETHCQRLIVNSANSFNSLNTIQIRPTIGGQQLQFLSTTPAIDTMHSNNNLVSGQLLFNLNPTPPQPQATAVLLPNGQILPIITQPQQQQHQPFIYAPNHSFLLTTPTAQTQPTLISGQTASIATNITTNTIHLTSSLNESQSQKAVSNQKTKVKTTTIESVPISPKPIKRKVNKKHKKISAPKVKNHKKDNNHVIHMDSSDNHTNKSKNSDVSVQISEKMNKNVKNKKNDNNIKSDNSYNNVKSVEISKSKVSTTKTSIESDANNCDILAKATESIFSPPPNSEKCNKKESFSVNERIEKHNNIDNISDKSKRRQDSHLKSNASDQNEVISKYCANITNKANMELINDTNKIDNYITSNKNNSKIEPNIAAGNKAEIIKKPNNNATIDSSHKLSNEGRVTDTTFHKNINTTSQNTSTTNTLSFGFCNTQNHTNNNDNQTIVTENELPSLLLSSLNDENDVSAESVHSVSNSSLPAFLSLSPEHLTEYLPKDNVNVSNTTQTTSTPLTSGEPLSNNSVQFRLNSSEHNVDHHSIRHESSTIQHQKDQSFPQYSKSNEISVTSTPQTETRSYSSNFPTISSLINNEFSEFPTNKSVIPNNSNNYLENLNSNINKGIHENNNFSHFPLQNENSIMPLYPMHSYHNHLNNNSNTNRDLNSNTNRTFFNPNENLPNTTATKAPQIATQIAPQIASQTRAQPPQQPKLPQSQSSHSSQVSQTQPQPQTQPNVMPIRTHRNSSTEQQLQPQQNVRQEQRHTSQQSQHSREAIASTTTTTNTLNKTTNSVSTVQYSNPNSFSSYSAEALIRQNEPSIQQIQVNDQNRYNNNNSIPPRIPQQNQTHSSNMNFSDTTGIRSSSRATISYSAESLIQSNSINNSNQVTNKSSRREIESESLNASNNLIESNRISYYQHINSNNNNNSVNTNNSTQRSDENSNTLFNFDHTLNSRISTSTSSTTSQNCNNSVSLGYPQITFNSHLPDIRTPTTTTSSNSALFPIGSNSTTVSVNSSRSPANSINSITNTSNNNNNTSNNTLSNTGNNNSSVNVQTVSNSVVTQQHSPIIYPPHSQNSQQNKRSTNNTFNPSVNPFSHSSVESYVNTSNASMYSSGSLVDTSLSAPTNHYQRSARNNDIRFTNCLQPSDQNANPTSTQHNPNSGCFFSNTGPVSVHSNTTSYFPPSSATPFPPLLPSAASPFDATTFGGSHRPPMFSNTFITDLNASFVNSTGNNSLTPITSTNFNISSSGVHNNNNNKSRDQQQSHARSSTTNISRSPNPSKHTKISTSNANNSKSSSKKVSNTNKQQNTASDTSNNSSSNSTLRHINDNNYFSVSDFVSSTATPQTNNRYSNFFPNSQTHTQSRHPVPSPVSLPSIHSTTHSSTNKNPTSSTDTSSSYTLFRPQSQNNAININFQSNSGSFSVNSLQNSNRSASTTTPSNFVSSASHHSHHVPNFNLSNIFPDINSNANENTSLSPMKFGSTNPILAPPPPPPPPVVPPPVGSSVSHSSPMEVSATTYPNHSGAHHQNIYHSHHHSSRISTPHNTMPFNSFLSSGTTSTQHTNAPNFDHHLTGNNRTPSTAQMTGIANSSHSSASFGATHHSHHTYANIVPSFPFSMHEH